MDQLHRLADELRDTFSERGHAIAKALSSDPAFRRGRRSESSLVRDLVLEAVERACTKIGLGCIPVCGGSMDVQAVIDNIDCRFRILKARIDNEGNYDIIASSEAIMIVTDADPDALLPTERWVLAYTVDGDGMLVHLFAAKVLGLSDHALPHLVLGPITELGTQFNSPTPTRGFHPVDEDDLAGMDDEDDGEGRFGSGINA